MFDYDIIYIGGGLNYAGAVIAAKNGKKVALIETKLNQLGGTCLHKGCIPSKMFLHYANVVYESKNEIVTGTLSLDMASLYTKKESLLGNVTKAIVKQCSHVELIEGKGKLTAPNSVEVDGKTITGEHIVIGTGSHHFIPGGIEYDKESIITSDEVLNLTKLPKKIAIYGVGAIGLEMSSFFAASGVEVTLINRKKTILKNAHEQISQAAKTQLEKLGIEMLENHSVKSAKSTKKGVHVLFEDGDERYFPMLLVATGRKPNTDVIQTKEISVQKGIITDEHFETTLSKHYAIGDCNGKLQLAHSARAETLYVTNRILGKEQPPLMLERVVKFIHTLPMSYAYVGKIKSTLEQEGVEYKESLVPLSQFAYSLYNHATKGVMISYVDKEGFILGAEIFSPNAEELIATVAMALEGEMDTLHAKRTVFAHPTFSEALERTFFKL